MPFEDDPRSGWEIEGNPLKLDDRDQGHEQTDTEFISAKTENLGFGTWRDGEGKADSPARSLGRETRVQQISGIPVPSQMVEMVPVLSRLALRTPRRLAR